MSDAFRQDTSDKVTSSLKPDSQKSATEQVSDQAKGAADSVGKTLQPEGDKSSTQKASDTLSGSTSSSDDNAAQGKGVVQQASEGISNAAQSAKEGLGMGGNKQ